MSIRYLTATLLAIGLMQPAMATDKAEPWAGQVQQATELSEGTVRKVDTAKGRVTIAHGPLKNLNMPPMTMIFRVAQPTLLDGIANGDRIRFSAEDQNGRMVVTAIQKAR